MLGSQGSIGYATDFPAIWNEVIIDRYQTDFADPPPSVLLGEEFAPPAPEVEGELKVQ